jgi:hypothetical protein
VADSSIPELLPLSFVRGPVRTTNRLRLHGPGNSLWADLPWSSAPWLDYQPAVVREGATCWADATRENSSDPVAASWVVGAGRVVAIGLDCFGFGHGTVVHWTGQRALLRRALDWLGEPVRPEST